MAYYRRSIPYLEQADDDAAICEPMLGMAKLFGQRGQDDSCLHYAKLSYGTAQKGGFARRYWLPAIFCQIITGSTKWWTVPIPTAGGGRCQGQLVQSGKTKTDTSLVFDESMRQQDIQATKEAARTQMKFNVLFIGLTALLIVAFLYTATVGNEKKQMVYYKNKKKKLMARRKNSPCRKKTWNDHTTTWSNWVR